MISPILSAPDADTIALDFGVFVAEQARAYRVPQSAIIAAINQQPSAPSRPKAAAASTPPVGAQAEEVAAPVSSATNNPEIGEQRAQDVIAACLSDEGAQHSSSGGRDSIAPRGADSLAGSDTAEAVADKTVGASALAAPAKARPDTIRAKILACHAEHPSWPSKLIAEHLDIGEDAVRATASRKKIKLVSWWDHQREVAKETAAKLRQAVQPVAAPEPAPKPATPPAVTAVLPIAPPRPAPERDATDELHIIRRPSSSVRFYVRDKAGRYLHQSLERSPTDSGPLMTDNRKWAWFDNAQRFTGASRRWPEIADMRREAPQP